MEFRIMMFRAAIDRIPDTDSNSKEYMRAYQQVVDGFISDLENEIQSAIRDDLPECDEAFTILEERAADSKQSPVKGKGGEV